MEEKDTVGANQRTHQWHAMTASHALQIIDATENGLASNEARLCLERCGENRIESEKPISTSAILIRQVKDPMVYLLMAATAISFIVSHYVDAGFILVVIVLQVVVGFLQEHRAERALAALREMSLPMADVIRDGERRTIDSTQIVPGNILLLNSGDKVAADARLLQSNELQSDETVLTGESEPVAKTVEVVSDVTPLAERTNMCWTGTSIVSGSGKAVVVATGMDTNFGKIAEDMRKREREPTPLQRRIHRLSSVMGIAGALLAFATFGLGVMRGYGVINMLVFSAAVAVAAIPEGLPAVITISLALGVQRMVRRNALVRRLPAVEALGSTTVICTDKTRTITTGKMTVTRIWAGEELYEVTGLGFAPVGEFKTDGGKRTISADDAPDELEVLLTIGVLVNDAGLIMENGSWLVSGSPTEAAILVASEKLGLSRKELERRYPRLAEIPFSSALGYMAIFGNIRRVVTFLFTTNLGEILVLISAFLVGLPLPLTAIMVLWINLVTDTSSTIPLGVEPGHGNVLNRPPRPPDESIVDSAVVIRLAILPAIMAAGTLGLFAYCLDEDTLAHARTVAFTTLASFEWLKAISSRSLDDTVFAIGFFRNPWLLWGIGASVALHLAVIYTSFGEYIFGVVPLSLSDWGLILPVAGSVFVVNETFKRFEIYTWIVSLIHQAIRPDEAS